MFHIAEYVNYSDKLTNRMCLELARVIYRYCDMGLDTVLFGISDMVTW